MEKDKGGTRIEDVDVQSGTRQPRLPLSGEVKDSPGKLWLLPGLIYRLCTFTASARAALPFAEPFFKIIKQMVERLGLPCFTAERKFLP